MYNGFKYFVAFSLGAAAGAAVAWKLLKSTYERIAQEEIDSVYEEFGKINQGNGDTETEGSNEPDPAYAELINTEGYNASSLDKIIEEEGGSELMKDKPFVISPEDFEQHDDYDVICLTCYADGVVADLSDDIVEDIENTIGFEAIESFGKHDDDTVYVQNDARMCYYEITRDTMKYVEVTGKTPGDDGENPIDIE